MEAIAEPRELNREEFRDFLDQRVRASLHMTLDEFITELREGRLDPESPQIASLAILVGREPARTAAAAQQRYVGFIQRPLACITEGNLGRRPFAGRRGRIGR